MQQCLLGGVDVAGPVRNGRARRHLKAHLSEPAAVLGYLGEHNIETGGDIMDRNSEFEDGNGDVFAFSSALY
jgi:hypothetical protein